MKLSKLQESDKKVQKFRAAEELQRGRDGYKEIDGVLHYQRLLFVPEATQTEPISRYYDDSLAGHFGINKTREFIGRKSYLPSLRKDVDAYVKGYNVCLASKVMRHKPYGDSQSLPVLPMHLRRTSSSAAALHYPSRSDKPSQGR